MSFHRVTHDLVNIVTQIRICVGIAVSEVNRIVLILKVVGECVRIVAASDTIRRLLVVFSDAVLIVGDLSSTSVPANVLMRCHFL